MKPSIEVQIKQREKVVEDLAAEHKALVKSGEDRQRSNILVMKWLKMIKQIEDLKKEKASKKAKAAA